MRRRLRRGESHGREVVPTSGERLVSFGRLGSPTTARPRLGELLPKLRRAGQSRRRACRCLFRQNIIRGLVKAGASTALNFPVVEPHQVRIADAPGGTCQADLANQHWQYVDAFMVQLEGDAVTIGPLFPFPPDHVYRVASTISISPMTPRKFPSDVLVNVFFIDVCFSP